MDMFVLFLLFKIYHLSSCWFGSMNTFWIVNEYELDGEINHDIFDSQVEQIDKY